MRFPLLCFTKSRCSGLQMDTRFAREQGWSVEYLACACGGRGDEYLRGYSGYALVLVGNSDADALHGIGSNQIDRTAAKTAACHACAIYSRLPRSSFDHDVEFRAAHLVI